MDHDSEYHPIEPNIVHQRLGIALILFLLLAANRVGLKQKIISHVLLHKIYQPIVRIKMLHVISRHTVDYDIIVTNHTDYLVVTNDWRTTDTKAFK